MTHPPPTFALFRNFSPEHDFPGLLRLRSEIEAVDRNGLDTSAATLRAQFSWPGHDPIHDRWVVVAPENSTRLLGYAVVWVAPEQEGEQIAEVNTAVHPEWRRRGLGDGLFSRAISRARDLKAAVARVTANDRMPESDNFLTRRGFQKEGAYTDLRAPAEVLPGTPTLPEGFSLRSHAQVKDVELLTRAMNEAYAGLWGHLDVSVEMISSWLPEWNQDGLLLLFAPGGDLAGISRVEPDKERSKRNSSPTGYIDAPGILPAYRSPALYNALLAQGVYWLRMQKQTSFEMESWGDSEEQLGIYQEMGFKITRRAASYIRRLGE